MIKLFFGFLAGFCTSIGIGGGTILTVLLSIFLNINQKVAQSTNLVFFVPVSVVSSIINIKNKRINYKLCFSIIVGGIIGSLLGSIITLKIDNNILRKTFAVFLFIISVYESIIWYKKNIKRHNNKKQERK